MIVPTEGLDHITFDNPMQPHIKHNAKYCLLKMVGCMGTATCVKKWCQKGITGQKGREVEEMSTKVSKNNNSGKL